MEPRQMTLGSSPEARHAQALDALELANKIRRHRAKVYGRINAGEMTLREVFDDPVMEHATIYKVLLKKKHWGKQRVRRLLSRLVISESRQLMALSERQKEAIIEVVERKK